MAERKPVTSILETAQTASDLVSALVERFAPIAAKGDEALRRLGERLCVRCGLRPVAPYKTRDGSDVDHRMCDECARNTIHNAIDAAFDFFRAK